MGFLNFFEKKGKKTGVVGGEEIPPPPDPSLEESNKPMGNMQFPALDEGIRPLPEFKNFEELESSDIKLPEISEIQPEEPDFSKVEEHPSFFDFSKESAPEPESSRMKADEEETKEDDKLIEFEEPEIEGREEIVPEQLPPIKKGPEIKIKNIGEEESSGDIKPAYLHPEGPVYVRAVNLRTVLEEINAAMNQLKKIPVQVKRIEEEEKLFEEWRSSLEGMFRRLNAIDRTLYLVNR